MEAPHLSSSGNGQPALPSVRSAFTAAFLSFLLPGLGHAYLRYWLRAVLWLFIPILAIAAVAGLAVGPNRSDAVAALSDPDVLLAVAGLVVLDLLYRLAAVIDAWRLGHDRAVGTSRTAVASRVGVLAIALVLVASHLALAQPLLYTRDVLMTTFDGEGGDDTELPTLDQLGDDFAHLRDEASPGPSTTPPPELIDDPWTSDERLDILLVGIDSGRPNRPTFLTDTMMVLSVDPVSGRVATISLPRDTVGIPLPREWAAARDRYGPRYPFKINTLYNTARFSQSLFPGNDRTRGYKALMGALGELYGLDIRYYAAVNLAGFRGVVGALDGLMVDVGVPLLDPAYPADDGRGKLKLYVPEGMQHMNGQEALAYARSRKTTSDFDRADRQQQLIMAAARQLDLETLLVPGRIPELRAELEEHVTTNIPARLLPQLVSLAMDVNVNERTSLVLSHENGFSRECNQCQSDRLYKLIANVPRIRKAVRDVFKGRRARAEEAQAAGPATTASPEAATSATPG